MTRVLISGGTGFVGTHLSRYLTASNYQVAMLASSSPFHLQPGANYYEVDIRDADAVASVVREVRPDHIYHLAGITAIDMSASDPRTTYEVNVVGAFNLFEAAMNVASPVKVLNVSTSQVYGACDGCIREDSPVAPESPYAISKAMAELLTRQYRKSSTCSIITARPFNHTGPEQRQKFVMPSIAKQFAEIEAGLRLPILTLGNVGVKRDFTDVRDVVRAYHLLLAKGTPGETYNVCSGSAISLREIIEMFKAVTSIDVAVQTDPAKVRSDEIGQICGDPSKVQEEIGWRPVFSLETTIRDLLEYWRRKCCSADPVQAQFVVKAPTF